MVFAAEDVIYKGGISAVGPKPCIVLKVHSLLQCIYSVEYLISTTNKSIFRACNTSELQNKPLKFTVEKHVNLKVH